MKKKTVITVTAIVLIIAFIATIVVTYKPYSLKMGNDAVSASQEIQYEVVETECAVEKYVMDLSLDAEENTVSGKVKVKVHNKSDMPLTEVCFRYFAPAICEGSEIKSAKNADTGKKYEVLIGEDNTFVTINLSGESIDIDQSKTIEVEFSSVVPEKAERYGYSVYDKAKMYNLTFCFPQVAFLDKGEWFDAPYIEHGETTYNEMSDYYVTLKAPKDYVVLGSGSNETSNGVTKIVAKNIREMAIVACNFASVETKEKNGIKFNLLRPDYGFENKELLNDIYDLIMTVAIESTDLYSGKVGPYIYDELDIIPLSLVSFVGMEMPGFIQIGIPESDEYLAVDPDLFVGEISKVLNTTCHEVGHQWFYCALGNDQYHEAWLDESFASYLEGLYVRKGKDYNEIANKICKTYSDYSKNFEASTGYETDVENKFYINFPSNDYREADYGMIYDYGENFLRYLEEAMGEKKFFEMLSDWYKNNVNTVVDGYTFIQHVLKYDSSEEVKNIINQYISEEHLK